MSDYLPPVQFSQPLPIPVVQTSHLVPVCPNNGVDTTADGAVTVTWDNYPLILAANVPASLLDPELDLRLELLWYKGRTRRGHAGSGYQKVALGFKHPADFDNLINHVGSDSHRGDLNGVAGSRQSEWSITSRNQRIAVNLSLYLRQSNIRYRDNAGAFQNASALVPSWVNGVRGWTGANNLKGINSRLQPLRVAFRYSIKDLELDKGRIVGALSPTLVASHVFAPLLADFPFRSANFNKYGYTQNPSFDVSRMRVAFERKNRIY